MGALTLRGVESEDLMGCGVGGDLVVRCIMVTFSMYVLEFCVPIREGGEIGRFF